MNRKRFGFSPRGLTSMSARHPWRTILVWIVVVAAITVLSGAFGGDMDNSGDGGFTSRPESVMAEDLIADHFGDDERATENIVVYSSKRAGITGTVRTANISAWC